MGGSSLVLQLNQVEVVVDVRRAAQLAISLLRALIADVVVAKWASPECRLSHAEETLLLKTCVEEPWNYYSN